MIAEAEIKTDKIDAKTLAELLRGVFLPTSYVPPKEIRALRHLVRHRIFLGRYRGIIKNQIKTELRRRNLKYQDGAGIFVGKGKKWLCNLKNPIIDSYLAIYEAVDRELKNAEREIEKVFSYAGLVPRVHQSGNTSYYGRITKEGSKYLRWILVEAVRVHMQWCPNSIFDFLTHCKIISRLPAKKRLECFHSLQTLALSHMHLKRPTRLCPSLYNKVRNCIPALFRAFRMKLAQDWAF